MSHSKETIGETLRQARVASGLTQAAAAEHVGLSRPQIANLEMGRTETSASNYLNLMDLYEAGIPPAQQAELVDELRKLRGLMATTGDLLHWFARNPYLMNGNDE